MDLNVGMKRDALRKLGQELVEQADAGEGVEVIRYITHDGAGEELTLTLTNEDMERDEMPDALYELT